MKMKFDKIPGEIHSPQFASGIEELRKFIEEQKGEAPISGLDSEMCCLDLEHYDALLNLLPQKEENDDVTALDRLIADYVIEVFRAINDPKEHHDYEPQLKEVSIELLAIKNKLDAGDARAFGTTFDLSDAVRLAKKHKRTTKGQQAFNIALMIVCAALVVTSVALLAFGGALLLMPTIICVCMAAGISGGGLLMGPVGKARTTIFNPRPKVLKIAKQAGKEMKKQMPGGCRLFASKAEKKDVSEEAEQEHLIPQEL